MRYENIKLLNPYHGVEIIKTAGLDKYKARIHINGNFVIGTYNTIEKAAIAYNKAVDMAHAHGIEKNYPENYIESISGKEYADIYTSVTVSINICSICSNLIYRTHIPQFAYYHYF